MPTPNQKSCWSGFELELTVEATLSDISRAKFGHFSQHDEHRFDGEGCATAGRKCCVVERDVDDGQVLELVHVLVVGAVVKVEEDVAAEDRFGLGRGQVW